MKKWKRIAPEYSPLHTRYQESPQYEEGLYELGNQLYAWMVPNGSWGESNAGLVVGEGESLLVDTLWDPRYTQAMLDAMQPITASAPIQTLFNTHADGDHWWGNELLPDADTITSEASYHEMLNIKPKSMILLGRIGKLLSSIGILGADKVGHWFQNMVLPYAFDEVQITLPKRTFVDELILSVGGREVQLISVGSTHTMGDSMAYIPDAKTLFSADVLFIGSTPVMWAGPVENWIAALDRILNMDADVIVPGHGPITDQDGVRGVKAYWEFVKAEATQRFQAGVSAGKAATDIVLGEAFQEQPFAHWNSPERMMTSVHTIYRHLQGRSDHPKVPELMNILRKQALLAHKLPDAQPAVMRKR